MNSIVKKIIREEINKLFETLGFHSAEAQQIATNMALFKLPRKGMDDSINNFEQVKLQIDNQKPYHEKSNDVDDLFNLPSPNIPTATVSTNIYETKEVEESYGMYGSTESQKKNLDWDRGTSVNTASFGKDSQDEFELHNNNIKRDLEEIPVGDSRKGTVKNNRARVS